MPEEEEKGEKENGVCGAVLPPLREASGGVCRTCAQHLPCLACESRSDSRSLCSEVATSKPPSMDMAALQEARVLLPELFEKAGIRLEQEDIRRASAAVRMQKHYRGHWARRLARYLRLASAYHGRGGDQLRDGVVVNRMVSMSVIPKLVQKHLQSMGYDVELARHRAAPSEAERAWRRGSPGRHVGRGARPGQPAGGRRRP